MISLGIHHRTSYRYRQAVAFGAHRILLRPRESRDLQLTDFELTISPEGSVTWAHDVGRNAVATAAFRAMGDQMQVDSFARIELDAIAWPIFDIAASAIVYPFQYALEDWLDLGVLTVPQYPDPDERLRAWSAAFVGGATADTLPLLETSVPVTTVRFSTGPARPRAPSLQSRRSTWDRALAGTLPSSSQTRRGPLGSGRASLPGSGA